MFTTNSKEIYVTDPINDLNVWATATLKNVLPGRWESYTDIDDAGEWGIKVQSLTIIHDAFKHRKNLLKYITIDKQIGVTSGQAGFYDKEKYAQTLKAGKDNFFKNLCNFTVQNQTTYSSFGVACSSGYGNGLYDLQVAYNQNQNIIAARLIFIREDNRNYD